MRQVSARTVTGCRIRAGRRAASAVRCGTARGRPCRTINPSGG
ncbi:hypothetical protein ACFPM0_25935 [Pseudonocardia sulfidoxydans]